MKRILAFLLIVMLVMSTVFANGTSEAASGSGEVKYPTSPIKFIVPFGAGGGADISVRLITKYLEKELGTNIVVQNVTGGSGTIGFNAVVDAKADGYTYGYADCNMSNGKLLFEGINYDDNSFTPVALYSDDPHIIVVSKSSGIKTIDELIAKAQTKPESVTYGLGGAWSSHDFLRMKIENKAGIKFKRMVFQSGAAAVNAVAGGNCDVAVPFVSEALAQIEAGNVIPLAISSETRFVLTPDIPTLKECGFDLTHTMWRAIVGPKGIDEAKVKIIDAALKKVFDNPEYQKEVLAAGTFLNPMQYEEFKDFFHTSHKDYNALITDALKSEK